MGLDYSILAPCARWCAQKIGKVEVFTEQKTSKSLALSGKLLSVNDARIEISSRGEILQVFNLKANVPQAVSIDLPNVLQGANRLCFQSNALPIISDGRKFNFALLLDE